jgi:hypothetical protein
MAPTEPRPIHVPPHLMESINKLVRTSQRMLTEIGHEPTPEELAECLGLPMEKVRRLLEIARTPITLEVSGGSTWGSHLGGVKSELLTLPRIAIESLRHPRCWTQLLVLAMLDLGHDLSPCRTVAGELVGDHDGAAASARLTVPLPEPSTTTPWKGKSSG